MSAETTSAPPTPPDLRWKRLVGVFALTNTVAYGALIQAFTVLLVPMSEALDASRTEVAVAATISTLIGAFAAVPVGGMLDRYGGRRSWCSR